MREPTIARNYAEALFTTGERTGNTSAFADLIEALAGAFTADATIRVALESPRVAKSMKISVLESALSGRAPDEFIRFVRAVIRRGRQGMLPAISEQFLLLVDAKFNRVHAGVTLAREPDEKLRTEIAKLLSERFAMEVVPHFRVDPAILGGVVVRMGDRTLDGSVRRRMLTLRKKLLLG